MDYRNFTVHGWSSHSITKLLCCHFWIENVIISLNWYFAFQVCALCLGLNKNLISILKFVKWDLALYLFE